MIVRVHEEEFIMIEQHIHGQLAKELMSHWDVDMFPKDKWRDSILTAISNHDIGWSPFDRQPFWNDTKSAPYSFTNFPLLPKIVLYRQGIDSVEKIDNYAAMLCSLHYEQFIQNSEGIEAKQFIEQEHKRRERLAAQVIGFDPELFEKHYALLQLGDNFSLYCCVNDPGVKKEDEHPFFQNGIPSPKVFRKLPTERIAIHFTDNKTITVQDFPFTKAFTVQVNQRTVCKKTIAAIGLQSAYDKADDERITLHFAKE
ncbi:hypothetical protein CSV79_07330 [Sporosarcina sp. P13]|uniref:DUF3891 family protein n=1 Tax=Sporosarcina sp. P13 TaxID=2048263 RepID=UPI000C16913D|nr:DUF3891 family protein [Sporosarcina sp. P13]PIC64275.1 hypothetical protein CSV79_07330 [Sporosarcina sp. P13]